MIAEARVALSKVSMRDTLVHAGSLDRYRQDLTSLAQMTREKATEHAQDVTSAVQKMYGIVESVSETTKPFIYNDGVAVIPVHGILVNRFSSCWGFVTGYNFIRAQMNAADADPDVNLIVFDDDSPGGDKAGCFELTEEIRALKTPTMAVVDDTACSGGYAIAAACNRVVATRSSQIGSIGVYILHAEVSGADAQMGVKFTYVFSGAHKVEGNPHEPLSEETKAKWQASVDKSREEFVADIAISRDMDPQAIRDTEAETYTADEALALGLVDAVSTPTEAVSSFLAELANDTPTDDEDEQMADLPKNETELNAMLAAARTEGASGVDTASIAAAALTADRERRQAILGLDEAKDRPKLSATLAEQAGMTADTAKVILSSAAVEKTETVVPPKKGPLETASKVGAEIPAEGEGSEGEGNGEGPKPSARILSFIPTSRKIGAK